MIMDDKKFSYIRQYEKKNLKCFVIIDSYAILVFIYYFIVLSFFIQNFYEKLMMD